MYNDIKKIKVNQYKDSLNKNIKTNLEAVRLLDALNDYDKEVINKTFFDKYFLITGEYREFYEFDIRKSTYSYQKPLSIRIANGEDLDFEDRKKSTILSALNTFILNKENQIASTQKAIKEMEAIDIDAIVEDLKAVYLKHNKPATFWREILEDWDIKYGFKDL